jgi:hypothetical protein
MLKEFWKGSISLVRQLRVEIKNQFYYLFYFNKSVKYNNKNKSKNRTQ